MWNESHFRIFIDSLLCRFVRIHVCAVKCSFQNWGLSCLVRGCIRLVWICTAYNDFPFLSILSRDFSPLAMQLAFCVSSDLSSLTFPQSLCLAHTLAPGTMISVFGVPTFFAVPSSSSLVWCLTKASVGVGTFQSCVLDVANYLSCDRSKFSFTITELFTYCWQTFV